MASINLAMKLCDVQDENITKKLAMFPVWYL
jgi:hypothetical protein